MERIVFPQLCPHIKMIDSQLGSVVKGPNNDTGLTTFLTLASIVSHFDFCYDLLVV